MKLLPTFLCNLLRLNFFDYYFAPADRLWLETSSRGPTSGISRIPATSNVQTQQKRAPTAATAETQPTRKGCKPSERNPE